MNFLIFGPEKPKLSFTQDPERGSVVRCDNEYALNYEFKEPITWRKVAKKFMLDSSSNPEWTWRSVVKKLRTLCQTDAERVFLDKVVREQESYERIFGGEVKTKQRFFESMLNKPTLIPQVWVNWIHYDPRNKQRAKRSHLEPFRVDFLYQGQNENQAFRRVIVEIDDIWHIADIEKGVEDFLKSPGVRPSLGKFTEHLRKDRWLRHHGWEVCRFSTLEVEKESSDYLYSEMQGATGLFGCYPTYFPHKE
jgi:hypothetical protein